MTLVVVGAARALPRLMRDDGWRLFASPGGVPSLIVGANDSGETLLRAIRSNPALNYRVVGFVDDRPRRAGPPDRRRAGRRHLRRACRDLVERHGVEEVLITAGDLPGTQVRAARRRGPSAATSASRCCPVTSNCSRSAWPSIRGRWRSKTCSAARRWSWTSTASASGSPGDVLMVTGSAGSIGSEICRQLLKLRPAKLVAVDRAETPQFFLERELRRLALKDRRSTSGSPT